MIVERVYRSSQRSASKKIPSATLRETPPSSLDPNELREESTENGRLAAISHSNSEGAVQPTVDQEQETSMIDFLSRPNMGRSVVPGSVGIPSSYTKNVNNLGFVNMKEPKCMLDLRGLECVKWWALVTIQVCLSGLEYGLLASLNSAIPNTNQNPTQIVGLRSANLGGYFFGPLIGKWILCQAGFKATFVTSLSIFCIGTLMFWPSGALTSYPGFIVSNFVVGIGLSLQEIASYSFLTLCGPLQYAEVRLLLAQGIEAVATTLSRLLSQKVFFVNVGSDTRSLVTVQWTYLAISLFTVLIAVFFYYLPLPEATDSELQSQTERLRIYPSQKYFNRIPVVFVALTMAVLSNMFFNGVWQSVDTFFPDLLSSISRITGTSQFLTTPDYFLLATAIFSVTQLIFAFMCLWIPPRVLLLVTYTGCLTTCTLMFSLKASYVNATAYVGLVFCIFEGPLGGLIFSIGLRGLGRWTKLGACLIIAGRGLGSSVLPFTMLAVMQAPSHSVQYSFCVVIAYLATGMTYPIYLNLSTSARRLVDPVPSPRALRWPRTGTCAHSYSVRHSQTERGEYISTAPNGNGTTQWIPPPDWNVRIGPMCQGEA
jgi:fucose permease